MSKAQSKFDKVMHEWEKGTMRDSHGTLVKHPSAHKQALAIAFSEARAIDPEFKMDEPAAKKEDGGFAEWLDANRESNELKDEYEQYKIDLEETTGEKAQTFKEWANEKFKNMNEMENGGKISFSHLVFRSHESHNPEVDLLNGYIDRDSFMSYGIYVNGDKKGQEFMEYYTGANYVLGSDKKSFSRHYEVKDIPGKYKSAWEELKKEYNRMELDKIIPGEVEMENGGRAGDTSWDHDVNKMFDTVSTMFQHEKEENKEVLDNMYAISKKVAYKEALDKFAKETKKLKLDDVKDSILHVIKKINNGKYKKEFRFTYGGKAGDVRKVSAASSFFNQFQQAYKYDEQRFEAGGKMEDGGKPSSKIPDRYKEMGFTHVGHKLKSSRPEKKWMVLAKKGDQYKVVHGGQKGMKDFSQHHSDSRRKRFWNRMGGKNSQMANDPFSPLYWHKKYGTWEDGGKMEDGEEIKTDTVDKVTMDVPLYIRMLEYAKEDAKTDMDLHKVAEKTVESSKSNDVLTMKNYDSIVNVDSSMEAGGKIKDTDIQVDNKFELPNGEKIEIKRLFKENIDEDWVEYNRDEKKNENSVKTLRIFLNNFNAKRLYENGGSMEMGRKMIATRNLTESMVKQNDKLYRDFKIGDIFYEGYSPDGKWLSVVDDKDNLVFMTRSANTLLSIFKFDDGNQASSYSDGGSMEAGGRITDNILNKIKEIEKEYNVKSTKGIIIIIFDRNYYTKEIQSTTYILKSLKGASETVLIYISANKFNNKNWIGGQIYKDGKPIAHVSFDGRVWEGRIGSKVKVELPAAKFTGVVEYEKDEKPKRTKRNRPSEDQIEKAINKNSSHDGIEIISRAMGLKPSETGDFTSLYFEDFKSDDETWELIAWGDPKNRRQILDGYIEALSKDDPTYRPKSSMKFRKMENGGISSGDILLKDEGDFYYIYGETEKGKNWMKAQGYTEGKAISGADAIRATESTEVNVQTFKNGGTTIESKSETNKNMEHSQNEWMEIWYIEGDKDGAISNISTSISDAQKAMTVHDMAQYGLGSIHKARVLKKDWDENKINPSNLKQYVRTGPIYQDGGTIDPEKKRLQDRIEALKISITSPSTSPQMRDNFQKALLKVQDQLANYKEKPAADEETGESSSSSDEGSRRTTSAGGAKVVVDVDPQSKLDKADQITISVKADGVKETVRVARSEKSESEPESREPSRASVTAPSSAGNFYLDIEEKFSGAMRNVLYQEKKDGNIKSYKIKTFDNIYRVFLESQADLDLIFKAYNEKRQKKGSQPSVKSKVTGMTKMKQGGKIKKFTPVKKRVERKSVKNGLNKKSGSVKNKMKVGGLMANGGKVYEIEYYSKEEVKKGKPYIRRSIIRATSKGDAIKKAKKEDKNFGSLIGIELFGQTNPRSATSQKFSSGGSMENGGGVKGKVEIGETLYATTGVPVKVLEYDPSFGGRVRIERADGYEDESTRKSSRIWKPLSKFSRTNPMQSMEHEGDKKSGIVKNKHGLYVGGSHEAGPM